MTDHPHSPLPEGEEAPPPGTRAMAIVRWVILGLAALAAVYTLALAVFGASHPVPTHEEDHAAPEQEKAARPATRYTCPMHPQVVSDKPGNCPICNMPLVPVKPERKDAAMRDGHAQEAGQGGPALPGLVPVEVEPGRAQAIGVRVEEVRRQSLAGNLSLFGRVTADESKLARVSVRVTGYVEQLLVAEQGAPVKKGQPLAAIYSDDLLLLQRELLQALSWGGDTAGPVRERLRLLGISPADIAAIESSGEAQHALTLRSPVSGFVMALNVAQGDRVEPDRALFEVADLSRVWVVAEVYERDVARVRKGLSVQLHLDAYPGETFQGRIEYVYPTLNAQTRTLPVRIAFTNPDGKLKPGLFGSVAVGLPATEGLTIPAEALIDTGEHRYVFVEVKAGRFEPRAVVVGTRAGDRVQVLSGLAEGERIAASGNFFIDSESRLRASVASAPQAAPSRAPPPPGSGPDCDTEFDARAVPDKYAQCKQCERVHRGMGTMEADCKNAIPKPWRSP
ncbi:efflux RND transporter periplasmic adaptor subunit [Archangium sp.]|uniref:efflux RND transporter periplasmic adaptor subunit n=1 Tax=Archangium sp. TaxID=1872627 RepID=UPI00389A0D44